MAELTAQAGRPPRLTLETRVEALEVLLQRQQEAVDLPRLGRGGLQVLEEGHEWDVVGGLEGGLASRSRVWLCMCFNAFVYVCLCVRLCMHTATFCQSFRIWKILKKLHKVANKAPSFHCEFFKEWLELILN